MADLIDRQAAINALLALTTFERVGALYEYVQDERSREREWIGGILDAIDAVICLPTADPRWIPCSEKLPTDRDWCLGVFKEKSTGWVCIPFVCEYLGIETSATTHEGWAIHHCTDEPNKFGGDYFKELTCVAWMPLPKPYEERREDDC